MQKEGVSLDTPTPAENDVTSGNLAYQALHKLKLKGGPGDEAIINYILNTF